MFELNRLIFKKVAIFCFIKSVLLRPIISLSGTPLGVQDYGGTYHSLYIPVISKKVVIFLFYNERITTANYFALWNASRAHF